MLFKIAIAVFVLMIIFTGIFAEQTSEDDSQLKKEDLVIEIHHCSTCGFRPRAEKLALELQEAYGIEPTLVVGGIGSYNVFMNDELIFSKAETGRFPDPGEIVRIIEKYLE
ncbi:MAG TPA: SelT/SelW/SelH family protein [Spirochaetes bacterium]|nr:SelT/SelW/SelH family protein [Spirochaetota bacterium]